MSKENIIGRKGGSRAWRNNNPGNIEYGDYAKKAGAIGTDGRFAIFPTYESGRKAQEDLLFNGKNYKDLTLGQAISRWAPAQENNVPAYISAMKADPNKTMKEFSPEERKILLDNMQRHEGWKEGESTSPKSEGVTGSTPPIPPGGIPGIGAPPTGLPDNGNVEIPSFIPKPEVQDDESPVSNTNTAPQIPGKIDTSVESITNFTDNLYDRKIQDAKKNAEELMRMSSPIVDNIFQGLSAIEQAQREAKNSPRLYQEGLGSIGYDYGGRPYNPNQNQGPSPTDIADARIAENKRRRDHEDQYGGIGAKSMNALSVGVGRTLGSLADDGSALGYVVQGYRNIGDKLSETVVGQQVVNVSDMVTNSHILKFTNMVANRLMNERMADEIARKAESIQDNLLPTFEDQEGFNAIKYAEQIGFKITTENMSEKTWDRLINSKSPEEFTFHKSLHEETVMQFEKSTAYMNGFGRFGYSMLGEVTDIPSLVIGGAAGKVAKAGAVLKNKKRADMLLGGYGAEVLGSGIGYAVGQRIQGEDYGVRDVAIDTAFGMGLGMLMRLPASYKTGRDRLTNVINKDIKEPSKKEIISYEAERMAEIEYKKENPDANADMVRAYLDEKFKDDEFYQERKGEMLTEAQATMGKVDDTTLTGELKEFYVNAKNIFDENKKASETNKSIDLQNQIDEVNKKNVDNLKSIRNEFEKDVRKNFEVAYNNMTPAQRKIIKAVEEPDGKTFRVIAQSGSKSFNRRFNSAISKLENATKQSIKDSFDFIDSFHTSGKVKITNPRKVNVDGTDYSLSYNHDPLVNLVDKRGWKSGFKNESVKSKKARLDLIGTGKVTEDMMRFLREDLLAEQAKFLADPARVKASLTGKKSKGGLDIIDGSKIYTRQHLKNAVERYHNNNSSYIYKKIYDEVDAEKFSGVHFDVTKEVVEPTVKPEVKKVDGEIEIPVKQHVLTKEEMFKKAGIDMQYIDHDFDTALKYTVQDKSEIALVKKMEGSVNFAKQQKSFKLLKRIAKQVGIKDWSERMIHNDTWFSKLLPPGVVNSEADATTKAWFFLTTENPVGATVTTQTVAARKNNEKSVAFRGVTHTHERAMWMYAKLTGQSQISRHFLKEAEFKSKFDKDLNKYRLLSDEAKAEHPLHEALKDADASLTRLAEIERKKIIDNKLPGWELLKTADTKTYIPAQIDVEKFASMSRAKRKAYTERMVDEYMGIHPDLTKDDIQKVIKQMEKSLLRRAVDGDAVMFDQSGSIDSNSFMNEVLNSLDIPNSKKQSIMDSIQNKNELKKLSRAPIDYDKPIDVPGEGSFTIRDIMKDDTLSAMMTKVDRAIGYSHLKAVTGIARESEFQELLDRSISKGASKTQVENMKATFANIIGMPYDKTPSNRWLMGITTLLRSLMLKRSGFTQFIEFSNIMNSFGAKVMMNNMLNAPENVRKAKQLARGEKTGDEVLDGLSKVGMISGEQIYDGKLFNWETQRSGVVYNTNEISLINKASSQFLRATQRIEDVTSTLSLQKPMLASQQVGLFRDTAELAAQVVTGKYKSKMGRRELENAGMDFDAIKGLVDNNVLVMEKNGSLKAVRPENAVDAQQVIDLMNFHQALVKVNSHVIQETLPTETGRWVNSDKFKAMMMMRSFAIGAIFKQSMRVYNTHGLMPFLFHTLGNTIFAAAGLYARYKLVALAISDKDERERYIERNMNPAHMFLKSFGYASTLSMSSDVWNFTMALAYPEASEWGRRQGALNAALPVFGGVNSLADSGMEVTSALTTLATSDKQGLDKFDDIDFNKIKRSTPIVGTTLWEAAKATFNIIAEGFDDE